MQFVIAKNYEEISSKLALYIASRINDYRKENSSKKFVLGLPTGGSIEACYRYLVELYKNQKISFTDIITFNMDEYVGLPAEHPQSYAYFMKKHLFSHVDIDKSCIHLPNGMANNIAQETANYEESLKSVGWADLFVGGIGENAHLAFNEPFSSFDSVTRQITLSQETREVNARYFDSLDDVPSSAISVGIQTIMNSRSVALIVSGKKKAHALKQVVEGSVSHLYPASILQMHPHCIIFCDEEAIQDLRPENYEYIKSIQEDIS